MIVIEENYKTLKSGVTLKRTYSDSGFYIQRNDGIYYVEAVDMSDQHFSYIET